MPLLEEPPEEPEAPLAPAPPPPPSRWPQPTTVMLNAASSRRTFDVLLIEFILVPFKKR
jgi:hypothetical protein